MADNIEHQDKGELVANCDQLQNDEVVVTTLVESRIMSIRVLRVYGRSLTQRLVRYPQGSSAVF